METESDIGPAKSTPEKEQAHLENARVAYQAAISLVTYEGNLVWARYGMMLLAHTIILTAIGLASSTSPPTKTVTLVGLSLVGLVLCAVWWLVNDIGFRYFFYWLFSARELEERYLSPVRTLSRGTPFADEAAVTVFVGRKEQPLPVRQKDRSRMVHASNLVIALVGFLYIAFPAVLLAD